MKKISTLAKNTMHVATFGENNKSAFTLAEVLITLGVIGVIAAITMPTLIRNYQKTVYVNKLKKSYSVVNNALAKIKADNGVTNLSDIAVMRSVMQGYTTRYKIDLDWLKEQLCNTLNVIDKNAKPYDMYTLDKSKIDLGNDIVISINDGSTIFLGYGGIDNLEVTILIDINGTKLPNTIGRDIFAFVIDQSKDNIIPFYGYPHLINIFDKATADSMISEIYEMCNSNANEGSIACTARIIEKDNWQMKY